MTPARDADTATGCAVVVFFVVLTAVLIPLSILLWHLALGHIK